MPDDLTHVEPPPEPLHVEPSPWVAEALKKLQMWEDIIARNQRDIAWAEEMATNERRYLAMAEEVTHLLAALRQAAAGRHHVVVKTEPHPTAPGAQQFHLEDGSIAVLWPREQPGEEARHAEPPPAADRG